MSGTTFVFNGQSSSSYSIFVEKIAERPTTGLTQTRERLLTIPNRDGQYDFGSFLDTGKITLQCWSYVTGDTRANMNARLENIGVWLDPRAGAKVLVISDQADRYWNAKYSGPQLDIDYIVTFGGFKLTFILTDPFSHSL